MEAFLKDDSIDFPFCFCWANEHWTNAWVSGENKILIQQDFNDEEDWIKHFNYLLPFFKDNRYIKQDGKPVFMIYKPLASPEISSFMKVWNELAKKEGLNGIFWVGHCINDESKN